MTKLAEPSYAHFFRDISDVPVVTPKQPRKPKEAVDHKVCPCCSHDLSIELFTANTKVYKHCNPCRQAAIKDKDTKVRAWLAAETPFTLSTVIPLSRCWQCGRTNPIATDFPVDLSSPTGYGNFCLQKCKGKRPKP